MFKLAVLAFLTFATSEAFWTPCADHPDAVPPTNVKSASCSENLCTVQRGEDLVADGEIIFASAHNRLDVRVTAYILGLPVHLPQAPPDNDACNTLYRDGTLVGCPTVPNTLYVWRIIFNVPKTYPGFSNSRVRFELLDGDKVEFCSDVIATLL